MVGCGIVFGVNNKWSDKSVKAKQLQDLSPALYEMLPKTSASTALIPAESLCRVNWLLAGKQLNHPINSKLQ